MFTYNCPNCEKELEGSFGDNVVCKDCQLEFETDYDLDEKYSPCNYWIANEDKKLNNTSGIGLLETIKNLIVRVIQNY